MKTLVIHLCGPFQNYGYKDYDRIRRTRQEPTKSAITGIIACCCGVSRQDPKLKEIDKSFKIKNIRRLKTPSYIGEEREQDSYYEVMSDYQIARSTPENPIFQADGKIYKENIILRKEYLLDAYFQVTIEGEDEVLDYYKKWMKAPYWIPYLGRKCCTPSLPFIIE